VISFPSITAPLAAKDQFMEARKLSKQPPPFQLSLRIRHPSIDPALLSRELAIDPEHSFRAGEPRVSSSGHAPSTVHGQIYWLGILNPATWLDLSFPGHPRLAIAQRHLHAALEQRLGWALSSSAVLLRGKHASLLRRIGAEGGQVTVIVALSAVAVGSLSLTPEVTGTFSDLGITIEFEFTND
jgi:hypothetical protein